MQVTFPESLDASFLSEDGRPCSYELVAIIVHVAYSKYDVYDGHYVDYVKTLTGGWVHHDDSRYKQVRPSTTLCNK